MADAENAGIENAEQYRRGGNGFSLRRIFTFSHFQSHPLLQIPIRIR